MQQLIKLEGEVDSAHFGMRLDQVLAELFSDYSRTRIKTWIENGAVTVDNKIITLPKHKVFGFEKISITTEIEDEQKSLPEDLPLNIVYEDKYLLVINKPKDLVVHPGAGNHSGTLLNALLFHYPEIDQVPRAGIVHRLDKDTTGLMVVAKDIPTQTKLVKMLQKRAITREYEAIVYGVMTKGGMVDEPISRHPTKRTQMAVHPYGKPAVTHYRIVENYRDYTRLRLRLETGRTHQIRVHMSHIAHPLLGDQVYAGRLKLPKYISPELVEFLQNFKRQALHARMLAFNHPITEEPMQWSAELPSDFVELVRLLKEDYLLHKNELDY